jgi:cytosine/adenosine deaminase-related metal-dependent hydrolase
MFASPVTFVNAMVVGDEGRLFDSLTIRGGRIAGLGASPTRGDVVIDLDGSIMMPGLINAHDHLELNSFARLKWRDRYVNVREWIADFQPRFARDPALASARPETLSDRVWIGGLKNLLAGVTTVCHHNPVHAPLRRKFPVRVLRRFGLSHSLQIDGSRVAASHARTPPSWPWIIHAAEGIDAEARAEVDTLERLRCLTANTVIVHGVALDTSATERILEKGGALVWCPSSNNFLFERTADVRPFDRAGHVALGTDSRLSGERDLLDELRVAARTRQLSAERLFRAVSSHAASLLRIGSAGRLRLGEPADVVVLQRLREDPYASLTESAREHVRLAVIDGMPTIGDSAMRPVFDARRQRWHQATVDGRPRLLARWIARRVARLGLAEPGFELVA